MKLLSHLANIASNSISLTNQVFIQQSNDKDATNENIWHQSGGDIANDFYIDNKALIDKITDKLKLSESIDKNIKRISNEEINDLVISGITKLKQQGKISNGDYEKILSRKNEFIQKALIEIESKLIEFKKEYTAARKIIKKGKNSVYNRLVTDEKKKYAINLDGAPSTKDIKYKILKIKELINLIESSDIPGTLQFIKKMRTISNYCKGIAIASGITSFLSYVASFFSFGSTIGIAAGATFISSIVGTTSYILDIIANSRERDLNNLLKLINISKDLSNITTFDLVTIASKIGLGAFKTKLSLANLIPILLNDAVKDPSKILRGIGALLSLGDSIIKASEIVENFKKLENLSNLSFKLFEAVQNLNKTGIYLSNERWIVVHETPLDKEYRFGGKGGQNLVFKNTKTNEEKTLDQMLLMSNQELSFYRLTKVYSRTQGWYIRTLPNQTQIDNLG